MSIDSNFVALVRVLINDVDSPQTYSDSRLAQVIATSAFQTNLEMDFSQDYTITLATPDISPDPMATATRDDAFANLTAMKAACILDRGSAMQAAGRAIAVKDGTSAVDLRGVFAGKLELLKSGWCAVYADAKFQYQSDQLATAGEVVMTPFRLYAEGYTYDHQSH